jgi:hypothetical protein
MHVKPGLSISYSRVIPAKAGIQLVDEFPRKWDNIMVLSASRSFSHCWIPAFAG